MGEYSSTKSLAGPMITSWGKVGNFLGAACLFNGISSIVSIVFWLDRFLLLEDDNLAGFKSDRH